MAEDREPPDEKGVSTRCGYASPLAWPHDEAGMIRLSPLGCVAYILANGAITLTNDKMFAYWGRKGAERSNAHGKIEHVCPSRVPVFPCGLMMVLIDPHFQLSSCMYTNGVP
jgi:hypothetical protein